MAQPGTRNPEIRSPEFKTPKKQFRIGWFRVAQPFQAVRTGWKACATRITDKTQSKTATARGAALCSKSPGLQTTTANGCKD